MDGLMTAKQVAEFLAISVPTVWRWARQGRLRPVRIAPRVTRFRREEIEALAEGKRD